MKVKTLRDYLIGLPEEFDDFFVKMTKHEFSVDGSLKRSVENIHGTIARLETQEVFLLDEAGSDFFDNVGNRGKVKLDAEYKKYVEHWGDLIDPINYKLYSIETDMPCFHPDNRLFTKEEFRDHSDSNESFRKMWELK